MGSVFTLSVIDLSVILLYLFNVCLVLMFFFVLYFDDLNLFVNIFVLS
jgi:hypothetical protein